MPRKKINDKVKILELETKLREKEIRCNKAEKEVEVLTKDVAIIESNYVKSLAKVNVLEKEIKSKESKIKQLEKTIQNLGLEMSVLEEKNTNSFIDKIFILIAVVVFILTFILRK